MRSKHARGELWVIFVLMAAMASATVPSTSRAQNRYWVDGVPGGSWSVSANWSAFPGGAGGAGVPGPGDIARITHANSTNYFVSLNVNASVQGFLIGNTGSGVNTLSQSSGAGITSSSYFGIGSGPGVARGVVNQSAGTNTIGGLLQVAVDPGSVGTYNLSGSGAVQITGAGSGMNVGYSGAGHFNQSAGNVTLDSFALLQVGFGSSGTYTLTGGSLTVAQQERVGYGSAGTFNHSGGTNSISSQLLVGFLSGSNGTYNLSNNGALIVTAGQEVIGFSGSGTFNQTGGSNAINLGAPGLTAMTLANNAGSSGVYALSGGSLSITDGIEHVGGAGAGTFTQTGGLHLLTRQDTGSLLILGHASGSSGAYSLSNTGALIVDGGQEIIGNSGAASFVQTGGSHSVNFDNLGADVGALSLGDLAGSSGTYTLDGGNLDVIGRVIIGHRGVATFTQNGGSFTQPVGDLFLVGEFGTGAYNLVGGSLNCLNLVVGAGTFGAGAFTQTGGSVTANVLTIASSFGQGNYAMSSGSIIVNNLLSVGAGSGTFGTFHHSGGTVQISGAGIDLYVGRFGTSNGTYLLSGNGVLTVAGNEVIGSSGNGTFIQSGGTSHALTAGGSMSIAASTTATGSYFLNGGVLSATSIYVGGNATVGGGTGRLTVASGAALTLSGTLKAWNAGSVTLASATRVGAVSTAGNGKIDLTNSAMVVDYAPGPSPIAGIVTLLTTGYAAGAWSGPGINSSTAALPANLNKTALGYAEASEIFGSFPATFVGLSVDGSSVLIRYTLYGDADLDGSVDTIDFNLLASNFGSTGANWVDGSFNYDSAVDTVDFNLLASNFSLVLPAEGGTPVGALVPEPAAVSMLLLGGILLARGRNRGNLLAHR